MTKKTVIVADDDASIRTVLNHALMRAGFEVRITSNISSLWNWISQGEGDILITDVVMPDGDAIDVLPRIKKMRPDLPILLISAQNTLNTAIRAQEAGANEYLPKPFDLNELVDAVNRALKNNPDFTAAHHSPNKVNSMPLVGRSSAMQNIYRIIARSRDLNLPILLSGEDGTGKGLIAKTLHELGNRKMRPFVEARLSAMPDDNIEDALFGTAENIGLFEKANHGTLYIEDISRLPKDVYPRMMRLLNEASILRSDNTLVRNIDVRIVTSTSLNLKALANKERFDQALLNRLNVIPISLPPLVERSEDIIDLVQHFLNLNEPENGERKYLNPQAIEVLRSHDWPGNIRELENLIQRICALYPQEIITPDVVSDELNSELNDYATNLNLRHIGFESLRDATEFYADQFLKSRANIESETDLYRELLKDFEEPVLEAALKATNGNQIKASKLLGLNRNTLRKKIAEYSISVHKTH